MKKIINFQKEIPFENTLGEIVSISLEQDIKKDKTGFRGNFFIGGEYKMTSGSNNIDRFDFKLPCEIILDQKYEFANASIDIDDFYYEVVDNKILLVHIDLSIDKLEEIFFREKPKPVVLKQEDMERNEIESEKEERVEESKEEIKDHRKEEIMEEKIEAKEEDKKEEKIEEKKEEHRKEEKIEEKKEEIKKEEKIEKEEDKENLEERQGKKIENETDLTSLFGSMKEEEYKTYKIYIVKEEDTLSSILESYEVSLEEVKKYNEIEEIKKGDKIIIPYVKKQKD